MSRAQRASSAHAVDSSIMRRRSSSSRAGERGDLVGVVARAAAVRSRTALGGEPRRLVLARADLLQHGAVNRLRDRDPGELVGQDHDRNQVGVIRITLPPPGSRSRRACRRGREHTRMPARPMKSPISNSTLTKQLVSRFTPVDLRDQNGQTRQHRRQSDQARRCPGSARRGKSRMVYWRTCAGGARAARPPARSRRSRLGHEGQATSEAAEVQGYRPDR